VAANDLLGKPGVPFVALAADVEIGLGGDTIDLALEGGPSTGQRAEELIARTCHEARKKEKEEEVKARPALDNGRGSDGRVLPLAETGERVTGGRPCRV